MLKQNRKICGNKGTYLKNHTDHVVVFDAEIVTAEDDVIWKGDLDLSTTDYFELRAYAQKLQEALELWDPAGYIVVDVSPRGRVISDPTDDFYVTQAGLFRKEPYDLELNSNFGYHPIHVKQSSIIGTVDAKSLFDVDHRVPMEELARLVKGRATEINQIVVNKNTYSKYMQMLEDYVIGERPYLDKANLRKSLAWINLDHSPVESDEDWMQDNKIYIRNIK